MLSERERQALAEIECQFAQDAPQLAAVMGVAPDCAVRWTRHCYSGVVIVAAVLAVVCLALYQDGSAGAGVVAACFAVLAFWQRRRRFGTLKSPRRRPRER